MVPTDNRVDSIDDGTDSTGRVSQEEPVQFGGIYGQLSNPAAIPVVSLYI